MIMTKFAVIENGIVENVIAADDDFSIPGKILVPAGGAGVGWLWDGAVFSPPAPPSPSTNPADYTLDAVKFEKALVLMGIDRNQVEPAIRQLHTDGAIDLATMADAIARWVRLETVERSSPVMAMLKPVFNVTDARIDAAWLEAAGVAV